MSDYDYLFKFIIVGDSFVGKSNILTQYVEKKFKNIHEVTIGVEFLTKLVKVGNQDIKIQIWDTAGQETFKSLARMYYKNSACSLLVYDISNRETFYNVKSWLRDCRESSPKNSLLILVGNKCDLNEKRQVLYEEAESFAMEENLLFFECSAKTSYNISEIFMNAAEVVYKKVEENMIQISDDINGVRKGSKKIELQQPQEKKKSGKKDCCKNL